MMMNILKQEIRGDFLVTIVKLENDNKIDKVELISDMNDVSIVKRLDVYFYNKPCKPYYENGVGGNKMTNKYKNYIKQILEILNK